MPVQQLQPLPPTPSFRNAVAARPAWRYLEAAHSTVAGVLDSLTLVREAKMAATGETRGRLNSDETNLLRAALVFTSSGLDACLHRLVNDCAALVIYRDQVASDCFLRFRKEQLAGPMEGKVKEAILSSDPTGELIAAYTHVKTRGSYQGSGDIADRVKAVLAIPNSAVSRKSISDLDPFFTARNAIVHDLDFTNPTGTGRARNPRLLDPTADECEKVFAVSTGLVLATIEKLRQPEI